MRTIFLSLIAAFCIVSFAYAERPMEELPMYGGQHDPQMESNKENAKSAAELGWKYFYKGDPDTAIRRFNQSWMFDRENVDALWGFGVVMGARAGKEDSEKNYHESIKYLEMANSKSNNNNRLMVDLAYAHLSFWNFLKDNGKSVDGSTDLQQARKFLEQAGEIDPKYPLLYFNLSYLEYSEGNYQLAKTHLDKAKNFGYEPPPGYEDEIASKLK
jgi:tetratricopeptide (TPR) repeat protein